MGTIKPFSKYATCWLELIAALAWVERSSLTELTTSQTEAPYTTELTTDLHSALPSACVTVEGLRDCLDRNRPRLQVVS